MNKIIIYCDGGCRNNHQDENIGGWGAVLLYGDHQKELFGGEKNTTNNKMELTACIKALEEIKKSDMDIEVYTDSAYLHNCIKDQWYKKWQLNGRKNANNKLVENRDLREKLLNLINKFQNIKFFKVKAHGHDKLNNLADQLANKGMDGVI